VAAAAILLTDGLWGYREAMRVFGLLLVGFGLFAVGCGDSDTCMAGTKGCTCYSTGNCRGDLTCRGGVCEGEPPGDGAVAPPTCDDDCDDDIGCTEDSCVEGVCKHQPSNDRCNDGQSCDLLARACVTGDTCGEDVDCDDDESCTVNERCQPSTRTCVFDVLDGDDDGVPPGVCGGADPDDGDPERFGGGEPMSHDDTDAG